MIAAVNVSVRPLLERHVSRLVDELPNPGHSGHVQFMSGNGDMVSVRYDPRWAAKTVMSSPASDVITAGQTGRAAGMVDFALPVHVPMAPARGHGLRRSTKPGSALSCLVFAPIW